MTNSGKIKFAVIGAGYIGSRHIELINKNEGAELVAICDNNEQLAMSNGQWAMNNGQWTMDNGQCRTFLSVEEMFAADIDIDVVCIATPNGLHAQHALAALNAGCHVVIEKPVTLTSADAKMLSDKATEKALHVFCVMQNRYSPASIWLKEIVESGKPGKIFMVQINCFWNRDERYYKKGNWKGTAELDGGTLFTQFSHFIDILHWVFGDIENISATFNDFNHQGLTDFEDSGSIHFDLVNGGRGSINYSTSVWDKNLESSITIIAESGTIKIGGQYMSNVEYCNIKDYNMPVLAEANPANDYGHFKGSAANHVYVFENVIDVINNKAAIKTTVQDAGKVTEIIERIYALKK